MTPERVRVSPETSFGTGGGWEKLEGKVSARGSLPSSEEGGQNVESYHCGLWDEAEEGAVGRRADRSTTASSGPEARRQGRREGRGMTLGEPQSPHFAVSFAKLFLERSSLTDTGDGRVGARDPRTNWEVTGGSRNSPRSADR